MWPPDFHAMVKREQYRDYAAAREQDRLAAMLQPAPLQRAIITRLFQYRMAHRIAVPLGRALLRLGLRLLDLGAALQTYGSGEAPPHRPG